MNRLQIGIWLLVILLVLGSTASWAMYANHQPMAQQLQQAAAAAMAEDWDTAVHLSQAARERWKAYWRFTATFADHTPMDELDGLFAELDIYTQAREKEHFAATCAHLAQLTQAMGESQNPTWWNLL